MQVRIEEIDSLVLGRNVLTITDFNPDRDFGEFEQGYLRAYQPRYVACKVPATDIQSIHRLESLQFRYLEFQISLTARVKQYDVSRFPYRFEEVTTPEDLEHVLEIASSSFTHDRFCIDPSLGTAYSGERYRRYVDKSFHAPDEFLHKLSSPSGEILAFVTHREIGNQEAILLLGGVRNEYKGSGLGALNDQFVINELHRKGIRRFSGNVSGINYPIMNLEIRGLGFRVASSAVVMRKLYD